METAIGEELYLFESGDNPVIKESDTELCPIGRLLALTFFSNCRNIIIQSEVHVSQQPKSLYFF